MSLWLVAAGLIASVVLAVLASRIRRRRHRLDIDPVTKEWLAQAASREDHAW